MADREAFNFYRSYFDVFNELPIKDRLPYIEAILKRQFLGEEPTDLTGMAKFGYISQKINIDKQVKGWEDKTGCKLDSSHPTEGGTQGGCQEPCQQEKEKEKEKEEVKEKGNTLLSEIKISDLTDLEKEYFEITIYWYKLFIKNMNDLQIKSTDLSKAKYKNWVNPIRQLLTTDKRTKDDLRIVYDYLCRDDFWKQNIRSTSKLREKFETILIKAKANKPKVLIKNF